jgi:hypothetical protein
MKRKWESMLKIITLIPTPPGWKAFDTWIDGETWRHEEIPIVGFGTVRRFSRREGEIAWRQEDSDQVEPLLFSNDFIAALPLSDYVNFCDDQVTTIVIPGETFDQQKAIDRLDGHKEVGS